MGKRGTARAGAAASVTEPGTAHACVPGIPVELRQASAPPERQARCRQTQHAGIEFVTHIMQELNWSPFYLQSRIEEIKLLYLIFNGKKIYSPNHFMFPAD